MKQGRQLGFDLVLNRFSYSWNEHSGQTVYTYFESGVIIFTATINNEDLNPYVKSILHTNIVGYLNGWVSGQDNKLQIIKKVCSKYGIDVDIRKG